MIKGLKQMPKKNTCSKSIFPGKLLAYENEISKSSEVSYLIDKMRNGTLKDQVKVRLELVRRVIEKEGDTRIKQSLIYSLLGPLVFSPGLVIKAFKGANEESLMKLVEKIENKPEESIVKIYKLFAQRRDPTEYFGILMDADPNTAMLIAIKARGLNQGIKDALNWLKKDPSPQRRHLISDSLIRGLLCPIGASIKEIPDSIIDSQIRNFLGN